jgi:hypothetical protein
MPHWLSKSLKMGFLFAGFSLLSAPVYAGFQWVAPPDTSMQPPAPMSQAAQPTYPSATNLAPLPPASAGPEIISPVIIQGSPPVSDMGAANSKPTILEPRTVDSGATTQWTGAGSLSTPSSTVAPPSIGPAEPRAPQEILVSKSNSNVNSDSPVGGMVTGTPMVGGEPGESPVVSPTTMASLPTGPHRPPETSQSVVRGFAKNVPLAVALRQILPPGYGFSIDPDVDMGLAVSFQGGRRWDETLKTALDPVGLVYREQGNMIVISHTSDNVSPAPSETLSQTAGVLGQMPVVPMNETESSASVPAVKQVQVWRVDAGDSLHHILESWCHREGYELNWKAEYDYPIQASIDFSGSFEDAVRNLLMGFETAHPQPVAELHDNKNLGQHILIVQARGNNYGN